jgi:hypothetical protein
VIGRMSWWPMEVSVRRTVVGLIVLFAVMLGAGAAGTPVNGDSTVAATTAGINLGHSVHHAPRVQAAPVATLLDARHLRLMVLLVASALAFTVVAGEDRDRSLLWSERRSQRGPPGARAA